MAAHLLLFTVIVMQRGFAPVPGALPAPSQQTPASVIRGTIQGIVKASNSSDGIPDVEITIPTPATAGTPGAQRTTTTDAEGHFSFTDVPVGRFPLRAQREGFFSSTGDTLPIAAVAATAEIRADAPNAQVTITLTPGGTVSGHLRDAQGRPASNVAVTVLRVGYQDGKKTLVEAANAPGFSPVSRGVVTNDRGEFRLYWYPPGEYYVRTDPAAQGRAANTASIPLMTYYPGTKDADRALPIVVHAGQETGGMDFTVESVKAFTVSGRIKLLVPDSGQTLPNGQLAPRSIASFFVVHQGADLNDRIPLTSNAAYSSPDRVNIGFELRGMAPGRYYIFPLYTDRQPGVGRGGLPVYYSTRISVEVIDKDVTDVVGEIHPFSDFTIHLTTKGDLPPNPAGLGVTARVQLRAQEALGNLIASGAAAAPQPDANGNFVFANVFPAKYKVLVPQIPPNYYLADIRQGASSVYNDATITVTGEPSPPVEVVISTGGGTIRGVLHDKKGNPASGRVVLIPQGDRRSNSALYKRVVPNATTGVFALNGIAPGEYKIFAWETLPNGADESAEYVKKYETQGRAVSVTPGNTITDLNITLIPADN